MKSASRALVEAIVEAVRAESHPAENSSIILNLKV